jgi:hypothetical protein
MWDRTRGWPDGDNLIQKAVMGMGPCEPWTAKQIYFCAFCPGPGVTKHHLVPRSVRDFRGPGKLTIRLCNDCHADVHRFFSLLELARRFNTEKSLREELKKRKEAEALFIRTL